MPTTSQVNISGIWIFHPYLENGQDLLYIAFPRALAGAATAP